MPLNAVSRGTAGCGAAGSTAPARAGSVTSKATRHSSTASRAAMAPSKRSPNIKRSHCWAPAASCGVFKGTLLMAMLDGVD
jgi:hypothetical protein